LRASDNARLIAETDRGIRILVPDRLPVLSLEVEQFLFGKFPRHVASLRCSKPTMFERIIVHLGCRFTVVSKVPAITIHHQLVEPG
jgi:hypothetical protein